MPSFLAPRHWLLLLSALVLVMLAALVFVQTEKHINSSDGWARSADYGRPEVKQQVFGVAGSDTQARPNPAAQKAGPPDPEAQERATVAATKAADAAATLATSTGSSSN